MGIGWFIFLNIAKDNVRELLNTINGYYIDLTKLESWKSVLDTCEDEYRNDFIFEIIDPFASHTLNYPSLVKQKIIYAACMLSHQTSMLLDSTIQDCDLAEHRIKFDSLQKYSNQYNHINSLLTTLEQIDNQAFRDSTSNFRNLLHHRITPRIELGLSGLINRTVDGKSRVSYSLGGGSPLKLEDIIPSLHEQHQAGISAFEIFWTLVEEQVSIWERESPNTT
jgi:hypothetical protein